MASMFQMQLVRYGNDHNILHIYDNILPSYSKTWVSESVIFLLLLGRIITGNNNSDLLHVNHILHLSTSIHGPHTRTPVVSRRKMETPYGDSFRLGLEPAWRSQQRLCSFYLQLESHRAPWDRPVAKAISGA